MNAHICGDSFEEIGAHHCMKGLSRGDPLLDVARCETTRAFASRKSGLLSVFRKNFAALRAHLTSPIAAMAARGAGIQSSNQ